MTFPTNLIQGPLAGISCAPFRFLTFRHSQPAFTCTEMISCKTILHQAAAHKRYLTKDPNEGPVCYQLSGNDPTELAEATKKVTAIGADLIDLNCGCPVKKIRGRGAGSFLLTDAKKLYQLIVAMKSNTHVPVSIKIRVEGVSDEKFNHEIANVVQEAGADFLIVHGRHWSENYETPCRHEEIKFFVESVKIPVIGNGDIDNVVSLKKMLATGCAGVMIARAGVGQPWLIRKLIVEFNQEHFTIPNIADMGAIFIEHVERLVMLMENEKFSLLQARKFAKYYARSLPTRSEFCEAVNNCESLLLLKGIVEDHFKG